MRKDADVVREVRAENDGYRWFDVRRGDGSFYARPLARTTSTPEGSAVAIPAGGVLAASIELPDPTSSTTSTLAPGEYVVTARFLVRVPNPRDPDNYGLKTLEASVRVTVP